MGNGILKVGERYRSEWPTSAALYLDNGQPVVEGTLIRNPDWARTLKGAIDASLRAASSGREAGIQAAIDYFYTGPVARAAVEFSTQHAFGDDSGDAHSGLLSLEDFVDFGARGTRVEDPARAAYRALDALQCGPSSQGPVFFQQLKLLQGFDLNKLGHNTAHYLTTYLEAAK